MDPFLRDRRFGMFWEEFVGARAHLVPADTSDLV